MAGRAASTHTRHALRAAAGHGVLLGLVVGAGDIEHAQHGVEVGIVRQRLVQLGAGAVFAPAGARLQGAGPQHPGHMLLRLGGNAVRQAVQVQAVFAQRFAVVAHWIARRELHSLRWLQAQIQQRSGDHLQPLALTDLPRELHQVGQDVNQLLHRLHLALDVERALAANAAHELRTPLASVRLRLHTAIEQAEADGSGQIALAQIQPILHALHTLSHRTERLLQLSRAEAAHPLLHHSVDLVQLGTTLAQEFWQQPQAQKRLDWDAPTITLPVQGDIDTLAIALRNLIDNALTYSSGPVELAVQTQPPALIVRDHGPGIPSAALTDVQQRHVRADASRLGYGLGLSIVGSIAQQHGAQLVLTSPVPGRSDGLQAMLVFSSTD